ncbi:MAG: hypothetical protein O2782_02105 [bacterium]|nr:hypothetical protein [bacterium]
MYSGAALLLAIAAALAAMWLLSHIDELSPARRLGRRGLLMLSAAAAAVVTLTPARFLHGGGPVVSLFLVMALCIGASVLHYLKQTRLPVYLANVTLIWFVWLGMRLLLRGQWSLGMVIVTVVLWIIFTLVGIVGVYPAKRRHLRRRDRAASAGPVHT